MTTPTNDDVLTAEMVKRACDGAAEAAELYDEFCSEPMARAALLASGLPAEVSRLQELVDDEQTAYRRLSAVWNELSAEIDKLRAEIHLWMSRYELAQAELSRLTDENARLAKDAEHEWYVLNMLRNVQGYAPLEVFTAAQRLRDHGWVNAPDMLITYGKIMAFAMQQAAQESKP